MVPRRLERLEWFPLDGQRVFVARSLRARLLGLALLKEEPAGCGLLLLPCSAVHTAGMRFALDLIWLGPGGGVVGLAEHVKPWRTAGCRGARAVIELPAGGGAAALAALA